MVKLDGPAILCKTDEVGELCLAAPYAAKGYWGLEGITNNQFKVSYCFIQCRKNNQRLSFVVYRIISEKSFQKL